MASITFAFTQADGDATGWGNVGVTLPQVVSNKLSTPATSTTYGGSIASGLTLTTYAEITVDFDIASGGSTNVWLVDGSFNGYGFGWGSASGVRIQRLDGGTPTNVDTDTHLAGGSGTHAFKFTRTSAGLMKLFVDSVEYCSTTETTYSTPATILISYDAAASVAGMDNLVVSDTASGGGTVTGTMASTIPAPTSAMAGHVTGIAALTKEPGATMGKSHMGQATLGAPDGVSAVTGTMASTIPAPTSAMAGTVTLPLVTGTMASTIPAPTSAMAGTVTASIVSGSMASTIDAPTSAMAGTVTNPLATGTMASTIPAPTSAMAGTVTNPLATGTMASTIPAPTSAMVGRVGAIGTMASTIPAPTSAMAGTVSNPGGAYYFNNFTQADGTATGWTTAGTNNLYVKGNKVSTDNNSGGPLTYAGSRSLSGIVDTSGDWRIDIMVDTALAVGAGGVTVLLFDASYNGYGVFVGNAVHIQKYTGGVQQAERTNEGRVGEGSAANLASWITMTRRASDGLMKQYIDGVDGGHTLTDTDHAGPFDTLVVANYSTASPTRESTADNLLISEGLFPAITYPPSPIPDMRVRVGGSFVNLVGIKSRVGGSWVDIDTVRVRVGGSWVDL